MRRKSIYRLAVIFMLLLCGCSSAKEQKAEAPIREELVLWSYYETDAQCQGLDKLVAEFNASQWDYRMSWKYVPMSEFVKELTIAVSDSTLPDIVLVDNPDMTGLVNSGFLEDITEELGEDIAEKGYYEEVQMAVEFDEKVYGVPFCCNNTAIIYNKEMLEAAGVTPPQTWEEFEAAAKALTVKGEEGHYGFAMSAAAGEQGAFQFMPWLLSTGATGENLSDPRAREAFSLINGLVKENSIPNDCMNWSQTDITKIFIDGRAAMMENGPWALPELEKSGIDYGICSFPVHTSQGVVVGGESLAVLKGKNADGAVEFIDFYRQEEVMKEISSIMGNVSPVRSVAEKFAEENFKYRVFVEQMEYAVSRKSIKDWKNVCKVLSDSLYQLFGGNQPIEEIWQNYIAGISEN